MKIPRIPRFQNHILMAILLPVLGMGVVICIITTSIIVPPVLEAIQSRIDSELVLASRMGLQICENHLNYLLELRLEDDREMNRALQKEAIGEISNLKNHFRDIHLLITDRDGNLIGGSASLEPHGGGIPRLDKKISGIERLSLKGNPVRSHHAYFPFWGWHVVSYVHDRDYQAPLVKAKRLVYLGTFGVLVAIWLVLLAIVDTFIRTPLRRLADATREVGEGRRTPLPSRRSDEIGQVVATFNRMVVGLKRKEDEVADLIRALRESEKRYREVFDGATEGILVTELATLRFRYANPAVCRMLGYTEEKLKSMTVMDLQPGETFNETLTGLTRSGRERPTRGIAVDIPLQHENGSTVFADVKSSIVTIDGVHCHLGFFTDVTDRKAAHAQREALEARLHRSEKMEAIGLLAGGVAHDLNNILSGLVSYPELLLVDLPEESPLRGPIKTIERSGKRAAAIVQDLLTLARRGVAASRVVDLNRTVSDYLQTPEHHRLLNYHPHVDIRVDLDDHLMNIKGSTVHLSKTVMNLVSNAAEAVDPSGGTVTLATRNQYVDRPIRGYDEVKQGDYAVLTVADDGIGIAAEDLKRIFEPFYSKKVMGRSGTGLGMAVVWGTVKDHDGYIDVISRPDQGTTFELYFPVTAETRDASIEPHSIADLSGNGETILVVDDVPEQREIATRILQRLGYAVTAVSSGEAAVAYLQNGHADLLILDMIMDPGMDGLQTYREVLKHHPHQRAIVASGYSENERVRDVRRIGARQYVRKPYTLEGIGLAVKTELQASRPPRRTV